MRLGDIEGLRLPCRAAGQAGDRPANNHDEAERAPIYARLRFAVGLQQTVSCAVGSCTITPYHPMPR